MAKKSKDKTKLSTSDTFFDTKTLYKDNPTAPTIKSGMEYKLIPIKDSGKTAIFIQDPNPPESWRRLSKPYYTNRILIPSEEPVTNRPDITSNRLEYLKGDSIIGGRLDVDHFIDRIEEDQKFLGKKNPHFTNIKNNAGWISIKASDKNGSIREDDLLARYVDTSTGVGTGNKSNARNIFVDWSVDAKVHTEPSKRKSSKQTQYPNNLDDKRNLQNLYSWVQRPNLYDVDLIDTTDSKFRPEAKQVLKAIVTGKPEDIETFKKIIAKNFTQREQRLLNRAIVKLENPNRTGVAGVYYNSEKNRRNKDVLVIKPSALYKPEGNKNSPNKEKIDEDSSTHEFIHMLRERDDERTGVQKAPPDYRGDDADLEESMTDLEAITRATSNPDQYQAGYHHHNQSKPEPARLKNVEIPIDDPRAKKLYDLMLVKKEWTVLKPKVKDRDYYLPKNADKLNKEFVFDSFYKAITNKIYGKETKKLDIETLKIAGINNKDVDRAVKKIMKTKKGKRAIKDTEKAFPSTIMGSLSKHGQGDLIDRFFEYQTKDGKTRIETQIYSPKGNVSKKGAIEIASLGRTSGKLIEEEDGKKIAKNLLKDIRLKKPEPKINKPKLSKKFRR